MSTVLFSNNASTTLAGAITNSALTANLSSGSGVEFPSPGAGQYFCGTFIDAATGLITEIVHVTAVVGDTITMIRAQEGTTAQAWNAGDIFANLNTAGTMQALVQASQLTASPLGARLAHGECRFNFSSGTAIALVPANGSNVIINGVQNQIPSAGVSAANTAVLVNGTSGNLAVSTNYLVSLYSNAGTLTLAFWALGTYSHMPDTTAGNIGVEVISSAGTPNSLHTLVGMIRTNGSSQFVSSATQRFVITWFNRQLVVGVNTLSGASTASTSASGVELDSTKRLEILIWAGEWLEAAAAITVTNTGVNNNNGWINIDGTLPGQGSAGGVTGASTPEVALCATNRAQGEGYHYASIFGSVSAGTGTFGSGFYAQTRG